MCGGNGVGDLLLIVGVIWLLISIHPFVFYPLSLQIIAFLRPIQSASSPPLDPAVCKVALCLCAHNEERVIHGKVENMLAMRRAIPDLEILVYVDGAADRTAEILARFGADIRVFVSETRHGKTYGMNTLISATAADIIVFTDANVRFADDALIHLLRPFADARVGCVLGHLRYVTRVASATAMTGSLYWRMEERIKELESRTGSAITSDGSIFAIRRALHAPPPLDISDDIYVSLSILCAGYRVVRAGDAIAYEDIVSDSDEEFVRKIRIACQAFNAHRLLWPRLRGLPPLDLYKYVSHKLLRWLTIYLQLAGVLFILAGLEVSTGWPAAVLAGVAAAVAARIVWASSTGPLGKAGSILQAFVATGLGVWRSYRGERFQTWTSPASARLEMSRRSL
jgi:cellulose synthase/poly-beta-1,6-N-acetylglucosamine synthase-like glycosyltransferase